MNLEEKKSIKNFIGNMANKDYHTAKLSLEQIVAEKIKNKVRKHVNKQEKEHNLDK